MQTLKRLCGIFLVALVSVFSLFGEPASGNGKWAFGIYTGWSNGLGWDFDWHYRSSLSDKTTLQGLLGAYTRHDISDMFGVQLDANFQAGLNEWTFQYWDWPKDQGKDRFEIFSLSLQGILHFLTLPRLRVYGLGGGGISSGAWGKYGGFSEIYYHLIAGLGVKFSLSSSRIRPALNLGGTFHHFKDAADGSTQTADYVSICLGLEF